jgi:hypothetical protein
LHEGQTQLFNRKRVLMRNIQNNSLLPSKALKLISMAATILILSSCGMKLEKKPLSTPTTAATSAKVMRSLASIDSQVDFILTNSMVLTKDTTITANRIYLYRNSLIITQGYKLTLKAQNLYADHARIMTFPEFAQAPISMNGRSGGQVVFEVDRAMGELILELRGEHGGQGLNGNPYMFAATNGVQGQRGGNHCLRLIIGGPLKCICTRNPTNGGNGAPGAQGQRGQNGGNGGNSGSASIKIADRDQLNLFVFQFPGMGGSAGLGGPGQKGGKGGPPGDRTTSECNPGLNGFDGADGPPGDFGLRGNDGEKEAIIYL